MMIKEMPLAAACAGLELACEAMMMNEGAVLWTMILANARRASALILMLMRWIMVVGASSVKSRT